MNSENTTLNHHIDINDVEISSVEHTSLVYHKHCIIIQLSQENKSKCLHNLSVVVSSSVLIITGTFLSKDEK